MTRLQSTKEKPDILTFTSSIQKLNLCSISFWNWSIPIFIILIVFLFNLSYLFVDILWHDDGLWYFKASNGNDLLNTTDRGRISVLTPYRDWFYSYSMLHLGLPFTRGVFVFIMALISLLLYYLYRNIFGIDTKIAVTAAVIPNILPSLKGIPVGLNASYAMWGLLPILLSLLILSKTFNKKGLSSWLLFFFALVTYSIGLNLTGSATFLIPSVLFFFLFYFPQAKIRTLIYGISFLGLGLWKVYKQNLYTHRKPTNIPTDIVLDRIGEFFEMASFLPFNQSYSIYITISLSILGIVGLIFWSVNLYQQPEHFKYNKNRYRLLIVFWALCWISSNSFAYIFKSPVFRVYDYAYVFNFGLILLQILGIVFLLSIVLLLLQNKRRANFAITFILAISLLSSGIQRRNNCHYEGTESTKFIRKSLSKLNLLPNAQVIILDFNAHAAGNIYMNSGLLRYILQRNDITGVIGPDKYPNNIFAKPTIWFDRMKGFNPKKPIVAFRLKDNCLEDVELMLQVMALGKEGSCGLAWTLYDVSSKQVPVKLANGVGMLSYTDYLNNKLAKKFSNADIAFSPKDLHDDFVDDSIAEKIAKKGGLINEENNIGEYLTLRNISPISDNNKTYLQILLRVNDMPTTRFKLSYTIDSVTKLVPIWDFVMKDCNILITTPPIELNKLEKGISLGFVNTGLWPNIPLLFVDGEFAGQSQMIFQPDYSNRTNN